MSRVLSNSVQLLMRRRAYTAAAHEEPAAAASSVMRKVALDASRNYQQGGGKARLGVEGAAEKKGFWMRDPKTGNWLPETHFNEVDPAELRAKFLISKEF